MTTPERVRRAVPADLRALAALYAQAAARFGPSVYTPAQVAAWVGFAADAAAFRAYVLGAETWVATDADDSQPLGFCGICEDGEIRSLYVRPGRTRQGLGTRLLAHAMTRARARGAERFEAWATPFSRPVFERAGMRLAAVVREPFNGEVFDRFRMASPGPDAPSGAP